MKVAILSTVLAVLYVPTNAQNPVIAVGRYKATYLIISGTVPDRPDIGNHDNALALTKVESKSNTASIFRLQALKDQFRPTNILIPCADTLFEFNIEYAGDPPKTRYFYHFEGKARQDIFSHQADQISDEVISNGMVAVAATKMRKLKEAVKNLNISTSSNGVIFLLANIGIDSAHHYFKFKIKNNSTVPYNIDYLKFITEGKGKRSIGSRSGILTRTEYPTYVEWPENPITINPGHQHELIYALDLLPLTDGDQLIIAMQEKSAYTQGRSLTLHVRPLIFKRQGRSQKIINL